jgi:hypothetical protein
MYPCGYACANVLVLLELGKAHACGGVEGWAVRGKALENFQAVAFNSSHDSEGLVIIYCL